MSNKRRAVSVRPHTDIRGWLITALAPMFSPKTADDAERFFRGASLDAIIQKLARMLLESNVNIGALLHCVPVADRDEVLRALESGDLPKAVADGIFDENDAKDE